MIRMLVALLALLGLQARASGAPAAENPPKVTDPQEAALQVNLEVQTWNVRRRECAKLLPEQAQGIDGLYIHWLDENDASVRGMLAYAEQSKIDMPFSVTDVGLPGDGLDEEAARYNFSPRDFCTRLFTSLQAGDFNIDRSYPDVAELLARYLAAHPLSVQGARAYDNPMGCMKAALNKNLDYDGAQPMCRCAWNAMRKEFKAAEWTEYETAVASGKSRELVEALPQYQRVMPRLADCAKLVPAK